LTFDIKMPLFVKVSWTQNRWEESCHKDGRVFLEAFEMALGGAASNDETSKDTIIACTGIG
jgi:hypothetical protein